MDGEPIAEGTLVLAFPKLYEVISTGEIGGTPVVEVDTGKPKPPPDVPLFKGRTRYCEETLAWMVDIQVAYAEWGNPPSSVFMGGYQYMVDSDNALEGIPAASLAASAIQHAKSYLMSCYGPPHDESSRDRHSIRLGLLVGFLGYLKDISEGNKEDA